jgi:hypothetical protein
MTRCASGRVAVSLNFDGGGHGQEASEEGKKGTEEEEESGRPKGSGKVDQENRPEDGGEEKVRAEGGRRKASQEGDADEGAGGPGGRGTGPVHGGDAGGENGVEPRRSLAFSDGLEALNGPRMNCGQSEALRTSG